MITELKPGEIFVFGSNLSGRHGKGAAKMAMKFGAIYGQGYGLQGRTYGIPTMGFCSSRNGLFDAKRLPLREIEKYVIKFIEFAKFPDSQNMKFLVTEIGCGLAGYKYSDIAPMFEECRELPNVYLPKNFL